jgi:cystathionine beta-lyase family protein involved in aluminum resistance
MRNHVKNNDFESFRSGLPSKIKNNEKHAKELFDDVHKNLHESCIRMKSAIETVLEAYKRSQINEAHLRDPDTYLRMATQAREQGKVLRASLLTRIAAAIRRRDISTATALRNDLPGTQE